VHIYEVTVPGESRLDITHTLKMDKYSHFENDIKNYSVSVTLFEVKLKKTFLQSQF
jgi:hypothetical protein